MSESLRAYIAARGLDARLVMNELQEHRVISDNAVDVADVGNDQRALRSREVVRRAA